ncbi:hypothetical protein BDR05DRAFT_990471 [Suillus weaverae]|nr:hypothetical protein BDR05DRAFT_990471 [Suillus weaverae]
MRHSTIMPGSWEGRYIKLEAISGKNLKVPSERIPAGIGVSINLDSSRRWKSAIGVLSSDESTAWADTVTLSLDASTSLSVGIWASFEFNQMLGGGEVIGKFDSSWDDLLDRGDEPFGHVQFARYAVPSSTVSHLNNAVQHFQLVLGQCPVSHPERATALTNLAWRYSQERTAVSIHESAQLYCKLLPLCPEGTYLRSIAAGADGVDYVIRACTNFQKTYLMKSRLDYLGGLLDLNEAISLYEGVLSLCPVGHTSRDFYLNNLATALLTRYNQHNDVDDITRAIDLLREALTLRMPWNKNCDHTLNNLAGALQTKHDNFIPGRISMRPLTCTDSNEDIKESIQLCQESLMALPSLHPDRYFSYLRLQEAYLSRYRVQHDSADLSLAHRDTLPKAFRVELKQLCAGLTQLKIVKTTLPSKLELAEQGRGQLWSLASRLRTPLEDLKSYRRLQEQWDAVVAEIQNIRGFSRFLLPPSYEDVQAAARHGPVIILIATEKLCSAIIVPTSGEPHHVRFPRITLIHLEKFKNDFARAIRHASNMGPKQPRIDLMVLLRSVWDEIMLPIVNVLEHVLKVRHHSRIWLCPTAAFTSIPLHAAHPFRTNADRSKEPCLEDLYICSYTPTLSALTRSIQMMRKRVPPSFVAIGQGQPGAGKALLAVDSEIELVCKLVPTTANPTILTGNNATRAGALEALQRNTWVHLACHGKQDREQPYYSHFAMRDERLMLLDIMENDTPHAQFAFLSACHTAVVDEKTPDEGIHLAAGLQFSGFKSVIATLWEVDDAVAKHVVKAFYENMFDDGVGVMDCTKAAWALNRATHAVKTEVPLEQRMVFIHIVLQVVGLVFFFISVLSLPVPVTLYVYVRALCCRSQRIEEFK